MNEQYTEIVVIFPNMKSETYYVRNDSWDHFITHHLNYPDPGNCFLPCLALDKSSIYIDMTKLIGFSVIDKEKKKKVKNK